MAYAIMRIEKLKSGGSVGGSSSHVMRTRNTPNADPARTHLNQFLVGAGGSPLDAINARVSEVCHGKIRKNGVVAVEYLLSASPEFFAEKSAAQVQKWATESVAFLQKKWGAQNIVHATLHMDETSPHLHVYHVPVVENKHGQPSLCAKKLYDGKTKLSALQTEYAQAMKSFELQRGVKGSRATHEKVSSFYGDLDQIDRLKTPTPPTISRPPVLLTDSQRVKFEREQNAQLIDYTQKMRDQYASILKSQRRLKKALAAERAKTAVYAQFESAQALQQVIDSAQLLTQQNQGLQRENDTLKQENQRLQNENGALAHQNRRLDSDLMTIGSILIKLKELTGVTAEKLENWVVYAQKKIAQLDQLLKIDSKPKP